jgi:hypothetical protein
MCLSMAYEKQQPRRAASDVLGSVVGEDLMKRRHHLKEIIVRADEQSLNGAIDEKMIRPENIVSVMLQPSNGLAVGDYEAKFRVLYRI